jgi:hypothetical protein
MPTKWKESWATAANRICLIRRLGGGAAPCPPGRPRLALPGTLPAATVLAPLGPETAPTDRSRALQLTTALQYCYEGFHDYDRIVRQAMAKKFSSY